MSVSNASLYSVKNSVLCASDTLLQLLTMYIRFIWNNVRNICRGPREVSTSFKMLSGACDIKLWYTSRDALVWFVLRSRPVGLWTRCFVNVRSRIYLHNNPCTRHWEEGNLLRNEVQFVLHTGTGCRHFRIVNIAGLLVKEHWLPQTVIIKCSLDATTVHSSFGSSCFAESAQCTIHFTHTKQLGAFPHFTHTVHVYIPLCH